MPDGKRKMVNQERIPAAVIYFILGRRVILSVPIFLFFERARAKERRHIGEPSFLPENTIENGRDFATSGFLSCVSGRLAQQSCLIFP